MDHHHRTLTGIHLDDLQSVLQHTSDSDLVCWMSISLIKGATIYLVFKYLHNIDQIFLIWILF